MTIDIPAIQQAVSTAVFKRGVDYYQQDKVELQSVNDKGAVVGLANGSRDYMVVIYTAQLPLTGSCSCPASNYEAFCKHCVALALSYIRAEISLKKAKPKVKASSSTGIKAQQSLSSGQRIETFIASLPTTEVRNALHQLIMQQDDVLQHWLDKSDIAAGTLDVKQLKKRITKTLPYNRHIFKYAQVKAYFYKVEQSLAMLQELQTNIAASDMLVLIDYACQRLAKALEAVDDSGGYRFATEELLQQLHLQTCAALPWPPSQLANYLFALHNSNSELGYGDIPFNYKSALGDEGMQCFMALVQQQWDLLPALNGSEDWQQRYAYMGYERILKQHAEQQGNVDELLSIMQKTATNSHDYMGMAELCVRHTHWQGAEFWLAKARASEKESSQSALSRGQMNGPSLDTGRILSLQQQIYRHAGKLDQVLQLQWQKFTGLCNTENYTALLHMTSEQGSEVDYASKARDFLLSKIELSASKPQQHYIDTYLDILLLDNNVDAALSWINQHGVAPHILLKLARMLTFEPVKAVPLYQRLGAFYVSQGNNSAYKQAVSLLVEMQAFCQIPVHRQLSSAAIDKLRMEFKAKRNFIQYLNLAV
jgi:uncharacterized Zn finger protein